MLSRDDLKNTNRMEKNTSISLSECLYFCSERDFDVESALRRMKAPIVSRWYGLVADCDNAHRDMVSVEY